ncbi:MAG TPA: hypothetical protein VF194_18800 [Ferrovibrio sp.]|uniref:hypothetical protein n=1 Tax=Ferrovibrio sp. TaxID=1917215 RepID=UPI002ED3C244
MRSPPTQVDAINADAAYSEIDFDREDDEDEIHVQHDIATYPSDYTLSGIADMLKGGDIVIRYRNLREDVDRFGARYVRRFKNNVEKAEEDALRRSKRSILSS